jgi:membrane-bound ClpP family serine protease
MKVLLTLMFLFWGVAWSTGRHSIGGSTIAGIRETQEMLDFARKHNVTAMIEKIPMPYINTAMERSEESNVKYCFVVEIANTPGWRKAKTFVLILKVWMSLYLMTTSCKGCFFFRTQQLAVSLKDLGSLTSLTLHALTFELSSPGAITSAAT